MVKKEKKDSKNRRIITSISNLEIGETISPTQLAKDSGIHPDTLRDLLDLFDSLSQVGFKILRDNSRKIKAILRTDESLDVRNEIRSIKQELIRLTGIIDEKLEQIKKRK